MLRVSDLTKGYGKRKAVQGLSFTAKPYAILGVIGPNGAGKSTTFLCLTGLIRPDQGEVSFGEQRLGPERGRTIALIPETPDVYPLLTVWEHLVFVAKLCRLDEGWVARAERLIERLGLRAERDTLGHALSKGLRQKTLIAATILADTPILLFDEPMIGLDPFGQRELIKIMSELKQEGRIVLFSTHMLSFAEQLCDRLVILKSGKCVSEGTIEELRAGTATTLEEYFLEITEG